jgi:hypothetical protein
MRPYHIPLAVRIIISYRLFLLFCVYYGYSFPSTALLSVTHLSRPQLDPYFPPLHIPLSRVLVFSFVLLVVLRVHVSCYPIFFSSPPLPLSLFSHSTDLSRLHLPHLWMKHIVQTPPFLPLPGFAHQHFTLLHFSIPRLPAFLRPGLGFC